MLGRYKSAKKERFNDQHTISKNLYSETAIQSRFFLLMSE
jgi:hypothetical protein